MKYKTRVNTYKSPVAAMLWSIAFSGMGQIYNRDYLVGFTLIILEIVVNELAKFNFAIYYAFNGQLEKSYQVINFQWALYYPSIYAFGIWHAYDRAMTINYQLKIKNIEPPSRITYFIGLFFGLMVGLNLGLQWSFWGNPIFGTLSGGLIGAALGHIIEKVILHYIRPVRTYLYLLWIDYIMQKVNRSMNRKKLFLKRCLLYLLVV